MSNNSRKLLVVEDDPGLQTQLKWCFEGYDVVIAGDRETALGEHVGRPVRLDPRIDAGVIGGVRVRVGHLIVDDTVAGKLDTIRERLVG